MDRLWPYARRSFWMRSSLLVRQQQSAPSGVPGGVGTPPVGDSGATKAGTTASMFGRQYRQEVTPPGGYQRLEIRRMFAEAPKTGTALVVGISLCMAYGLYLACDQSYQNRVDRHKMLMYRVRVFEMLRHGYFPSEAEIEEIIKQRQQKDAQAQASA